MNIVAPLRAVLAAGNHAELQALPLGRGSWHVLFTRDKAPLLLPAADYPFQARCLSFFLPAGPEAYCARALLAANAVLPGLGLLPRFRIEDGPQGFLTRQIPLGRPAYSAARIGPPGPFRKAAAVLVSPQGEAYVDARIAMVPGADAHIAREAEWLRRLETARELESQIPRLLAEDTAPNGRRCLITTPAPAGGSSTRQLTAAHLAFLSALGRVRRDVMGFATSPCCESLEGMLAGNEPHLMPAERAALKAALLDCRLLLGGWMGPFVLAHGGFAPWNIRVQRGRIFVMDWQHARAGANPLGDVFNFIVMPRACARRAASRDFIAAAIARVQRAADTLYPEFTWRRRAISGLALAYLLEMLLRWTGKGRHLPRAEPVVANCLKLIEERAGWIAA